MKELLLQLLARRQLAVVLAVPRQLQGEGRE